MVRRFLSFILLALLVLAGPVPGTAPQPRACCCGCAPAGEPCPCDGPRTPCPPNPRPAGTPATPALRTAVPRILAAQVPERREPCPAPADVAGMAPGALARMPGAGAPGPLRGPPLARPDPQARLCLFRI